MVLTVFLTPLAVQGDPVVVELYTSQGCSSCPPADALFSEIAKRDDVIALALHVDYWDYIGWADSLADPAHTVRQKAYAHAAGKQMIYTPQMIIGGERRVAGNKAMDVVDQINKMGAITSDITLEVVRNGDQVEIVARVVGGNARDMTVQFVRFDPFQAVSITRGENAGRTIEYTNIVTRWDRVADWDGGDVYRGSVNAPGSKPAVVIVQAAGPGRILAAAQLR